MGAIRFYYLQGIPYRFSIFAVTNPPCEGENLDKTTAEREAGREYITVRVDRSLKTELMDACASEHRPLSSFCRLLLEYAFDQYRRAGSVRDLLLPREHEFSSKE